MSDSALRCVPQVLGPSAGGIRAHVATLAAALDDSGISAPVLGPAGVMDGVGAQAGVVPVPAGLRPDGLLAARRALAPWRHDAQVLHAHGLKAAWTCMGGSPRRPTVLTVHNVVLEESAGRMAGVQRLLERTALRRADRVIALTTSMAEELSGVVPPERVRVALPASPPPRPERPATEVRASLDVARGAPLVVCVARLHPQKDLPTLLRAWRSVHAVHPEAVLVVVGDGPERDRLRALHAELGLGCSARLVGSRPHAVDELAAADVAVMTSVWEGAALVLAEATQLGVPMVSTPTGLAADLLDGHRGGVVVPVGDSDAVAAALCRMLDDPAAATALGRRGRERARELFDPVRAVDRIVAVYEEVLQ